MTEGFRSEHRVLVDAANVLNWNAMLRTVFLIWVAIFRKRNDPELRFSVIKPRAANVASPNDFFFSFAPVWEFYSPAFHYHSQFGSPGIGCAPSVRQSHQNGYVAQWHAILYPTECEA